MSESPQHPGRREIGRLLLLICLGLFLLASVFWVVLDLASKKALARYDQQQNLNFADFIPKPVPDESNFALVPVVASSYEDKLDEKGRLVQSGGGSIVDRLDMEIYDENSQVKTPGNGNWQLGQATDLKAFQAYYRAVGGSFPMTDERQSPAADVLFAMSKYEQTLEDLRQAAALPQSRFPLNYDSDPPADILLPHLAGLKKASQVLELRAVAELQNGQSSQALADVKLMLRLMASVRNEPFMISQMVRIAMLNLALQPVWEGTQQHRWSDSQLKELDRDLAGLDFLADYEFSMRGQCALEIANMEYMRRTRRAGEFFDDKPTQIEWRYAPDFVFYHNEMVFARAFQDWLLPIADVERHQASPAAADAAGTNIDAMSVHSTLNTALAATLLPNGKIIERFSRAQSSVDMARVAVALERYRLAQGKYPDSLNALTPGFIQSVPTDVIEGKPLKYHRGKDGRFVLYSVGWNGTDDGGKVFLKGTSTNYVDYEKGDWVWAGQVIVP